MNITVGHSWTRWIAMTVQSTGRPVSLFWNGKKYELTRAQYDEFKVLDALGVEEAIRVWLDTTTHDNQEEVSS